MKYQNVNRIIAFRLGGGAVPTPPARDNGPFPMPPVQQVSTERIQAGEVTFVQECSRCHVLGPSSTPDLRRLSPELHAAFKDIVLGGVLGPTGMESFANLISEQEAENIHAYLIDQAWLAYRAQQAGGSGAH